MPLERLYAARYVLVAAFGVLLIGSFYWDLPLGYSAAAFLLIASTAAFVPGSGRPASEGSGDDPALGSAEAFVQAILQALPEPALLLNGQGTVLHANGRAASVFPATRVGDPFAFTFRWPEISEAVEEAAAGRPAAVDFHEPGSSANHYAIALTPLTLPHTENRFVLVTFADISDKQAIARMRADFVANASHELRTPLASLTGFIETLIGPARNDPQAMEKFLSIMLDQARRMRRLIDDLLSLSRVEMRVYNRPTERVDLIPLLHQVRDAMAALARENSVQLAIDTPEGAVQVRGDRDELQQVFQNLIENAIRYGASGGKVDISLEIEGGDPPQVAVHVRDYGPGIAAEHLPRLTERFYRVDVGASREMKGTGLGLAIVKNVLTRHQGRLTISSRPGEGARFTVELPYPQAVNEAASETRAISIS